MHPESHCRYGQGQTPVAHAAHLAEHVYAVSHRMCNRPAPTAPFTIAEQLAYDTALSPRKLLFVTAFATLPNNVPESFCQMSLTTALDTARLPA